MKKKRNEKTDILNNKNIAKTRAVYIVLSLTGTGISRMIKLYTREPYSHASISLDEELNEMYSFARKNIHNPFNAGFIKEDIGEGVFGVYKDTACCVYKYMVTEKQYNKMKQIIEKFKKNANLYTYSYLGILYVMLHKQRKSAYKYFCSQFVAYTLEQSGAQLLDKDSASVKPVDFRTCDKLLKVYEGRLSDYRNYIRVEQSLYKQQNA